MVLGSLIVKTTNREEELKSVYWFINLVKFVSVISSSIMGGFLVYSFARCIYIAKVKPKID